MHFVYILISQKDNNFYIGFTNDLERRIKQHNNGQVASTKPRRPFKLFHLEGFATKEEAVKKEKYYKSGLGREKLKSMMVARSTN
jgi:putative endonuclease